MSETNGLHVRQLLTQSYDFLTRDKNREIVFEHAAWTEIANDSDWHRTRIGYMIYKTARIITLDDINWVIGNGVKGGGYPADPYDSDIMTFRFETGKGEEKRLADKIRDNEYFISSPVYAIADGNLAVSKRCRLGNKLHELVSPGVRDFIAQEPEYNHELIDPGTMRPPVTRSMLYKPEFAEFLANSIQEVLRQNGGMGC